MQAAQSGAFALSQADQMSKKSNAILPALLFRGSYD